MAEKVTRKFLFVEARGAMRLYGASGKKQIWRPLGRTGSPKVEP